LTLRAKDLGAEEGTKNRNHRAEGALDGAHQELTDFTTHYNTNDNLPQAYATTLNRTLKSAANPSLQECSEERTKEIHHKVAREKALPAFMNHTKSSIVKERKVPEAEASMSDARILEHFHKNVRGSTAKADFALGVKAQASATGLAVQMQASVPSEEYNAQMRA